MYILIKFTSNIIILFFAIVLCSDNSASIFDLNYQKVNNNIFLGEYIENDLADHNSISNQLFKLFSRTTIDPELKLALDVSFRIESDSGKNLIGDNGKSIGPLHIRKEAVDDINRILGYQAFSYEDRMVWEKSCQMFESYLTYWGQRYTNQTGNTPTTEVYVRIWNGGPNGWKNPKTEDHWHKAQEMIF